MYKQECSNLNERMAELTRGASPRVARTPGTVSRQGQSLLSPGGSGSLNFIDNIKAKLNRPQEW